MTKQEIYDKVKGHLLKQGHAAVDGGGCVYRTKNGSKCAIGCLIPDEWYSPRFEGMGVIGRMGMEAFATALSEGLGHTPDWKEVDFLKKLQLIHDRHSPVFWADHLRDLAIDEGLVP